MKLNNITIGADPELFIINEKTGKVVSSIGLIPGTKSNPYVADDMPNGFAMETDNIVAEFNIPPVQNMNKFINCIEYMKKYIDSFVKDKNPDLGILCAASMEVDDDQLQSDEAKMFGCDIDYNAYTEEPNPKPKGNKTNIRSCGFHIHLGYENPNVDTSLTLIKYLDAYLGIPSVLRDTDTRRRSLYGKAGCFRLCSYGLEYRVLSSTMMKDTDNLKFVWEQLCKTVAAYQSSYILPDSSLVIEAINNSDIELANKLISEYNI